VIANSKLIWEVACCALGQGTSTLVSSNRRVESQQTRQSSLSFLQCRFDAKQTCQHSPDLARRTLKPVYITYK